MDRIFLPMECLREGQAHVTGDIRRHLADSLRVRAGERFCATDGNGHELVLEAEKVDHGELVARVLETTDRPREVGHEITLAIAPPRGGRMETAVEKVTECGVGRIVPLYATRSVLKGRDESSRVERWRRVARSATAQSGRCWVPEITEMRTLTDALEQAGEEQILLAHPGLTARSVPSTFEKRSAAGLTIFVGPEGGFTDEEREEGRRFGATEVSLGPTRLRSETAAIVAVTLSVACFTGEQMARRT